MEIAFAANPRNAVVCARARIAGGADFQAVANAGTGSSLADNYLPKNDPRVIAHTKVIGAGQTDKR